MGTSSAARPLGLRRTNIAIRQERDEKEIFQTFLSDSTPRSNIIDLAFASPGVITALLKVFEIAEMARRVGPSRFIDDLAKLEKVEASLPGILNGMSKSTMDLVSLAATPSLQDEIARRALLVAVSHILQGKDKDINLSRSQLERNVEAAITDLGPAGLVSFFLGDYLSGLALFLTLGRQSERLGLTRESALLDRKREIETGFQNQSNRVARSVVNQLYPKLGKIDPRKMDEIERLAREIKQLLSKESLSKEESR